MAGRTLNFWLRRIKTFLGCRCTACHNPFRPILETGKDLFSASSFLLCPDCALLLPRRIGGHCPLCGEESSQAQVPPSPCGACIQKAPPWELFIFHAAYEGLLRDLLLRLKFHAEIRLSPLLAALLYEHPAFDPRQYDLIVPVPLHPDRLCARGYNQAHELAKSLQRICFKKNKQSPRLAGDLLSRVRATPPQASLPRTKRKGNVRKAFSAKPCEGQRILLLDDIATTGFTLTEACFELTRAGAATVSVMTLAKTYSHNTLSQQVIFAAAQRALLPGK